MAICEIKQELVHTLLLSRCAWCNRYHATENGENRCGVCANKELATVRAQVAARERTIAALRGALKRKVK